MSTKTDVTCALCHKSPTHKIHTDSTYAYKGGKIVAHPFTTKG